MIYCQRKITKFQQFNLTPIILIKISMESIIDQATFLNDI